MAPRPFPDATKAPLGIMTMAYKDYDLLDNWVQYYSKHVDRRHLYILSHGNDPKHREIANGANIINIPRDPTLVELDRRRWFMMTQFTNGLLRYYNWMIVGDVDEIIVLDPDKGHNLADYLATYEGHKTPRSLSAFGIELVHNPERDPDPLPAPGGILAKRRLFRLNANYAKPCIVRHDVNFSIGGHANNHQPRVLDDNLTLVHLRFYDYDLSCERLKLRADMRKEPDEKSGKTHAWSKSIETFRRLALQNPQETTLAFPEFRKKMREEAQHLHNGKVTFFGGGRSKKLYQLPDRFTTLF